MMRTMAYKMLIAKLSRFSSIQHGKTITYASRIRTGVNFSCNSGIYINTIGGAATDSNVLIKTNVVISIGKSYLGNDFGSIGETPVLELPISIGSGVWIGANVTVLPAVTVAPGCIARANSVLLKSTRPDETCSGVSAKLIKNVESINRDENW